MTNDRKTKIYLAGPVQEAPDRGRRWRNALKNTSYAGIEFVDPLDEYDADDPVRILPDFEPRELVEQDLGLIRTSHALLVNWTGNTTAGTPMEMFFAYQIGKPVYVVSRVEYTPIWVEAHATEIHDTLDSAIDSIQDVDLTTIHDFS